MTRPNIRVDLPKTIIDLPNTMVDLLNTVVDLSETVVDLPNTRVDLPNSMVGPPNTMTMTSFCFCSCSELLQLKFGKKKKTAKCSAPKTVIGVTKVALTISTTLWKGFNVNFHEL